MWFEWQRVTEREHRDDEFVCVCVCVDVHFLCNLIYNGDIRRNVTIAKSSTQGLSSHTIKGLWAERRGN